MYICYHWFIITTVGARILLSLFSQFPVSTSFVIPLFIDWNPTIARSLVPSYCAILGWLATFAGIFCAAPEVDNTRVLMNTDIESCSYEHQPNVREFKSCSLEHGLIVFTTTRASWKIVALFGQFFSFLSTVSTRSLNEL